MERLTRNGQRYSTLGYVPLKYMIKWSDQNVESQKRSPRLASNELTLLNRELKKMQPSSASWGLRLLRESMSPCCMNIGSEKHITSARSLQEHFVKAEVFHKRGKKRPEETRRMAAKTKKIAIMDAKKKMSK